MLGNLNELLVMKSFNIFTTDQDEINDIINLVCMYYARLDGNDERYKKYKAKDLGLIAEYFNIKLSTINNRKDYYDALYDNGRKGWHQRTPESYPKLFTTYNQYNDLTIENHYHIVNEIIDSINNVNKPYFSIKTKDPEAVKLILSKSPSVVFSGINVLQDKLKSGQIVFVVLGGDKPAWDTGLIGMGIITKEPFDVGYDKSNFRIGVDIKLLLEKTIKRADLVSYKNTFDIIGIGPITKWEPNQALSQIEERKAVALMRAMLELDPNIETDLTNLVGPVVMQRIKGATKRYVEIDVEYGQAINSPKTISYEIPAEGDNGGGIVSDLFSTYNATSTESKEYPEYTKKSFLEEVFIKEEQYDAIVELLERKKNIILQGAPGVGKTFAAKRLAYSILGCEDESKVEFIQFHQSYAYEDFVLGYKPTETGFTIEEGPFYKFCKKAEANGGKHFFIIDEINRGNLSRIFGELLVLTEATKRNESATLLYTKESFKVPDNVYIIGMMNTADRSLAMIDYALRRRFSFFSMEPAFGLKSFKDHFEKIATPKGKLLVAKIEELNKAIENDDNLGKGFMIGHSYLCADDRLSDEALKAIVQYEIIPLLEEYWYDVSSEVKKWSQILLSVLD